MTEVEKAIVRGTKSANTQFKKMSEGWWLGNAPEHFIEVVIAQEIAKADY